MINLFKRLKPIIILIYSTKEIEFLWSNLWIGRHKLVELRLGV
jgi:hypothetical protein